MNYLRDRAHLIIPFSSLVSGLIITLNLHNPFTSFFIGIYAITIPGLSLIDFLPFNDSLDNIEKLCVSNFLSILLIVSIGLLINAIWILNNWSIMLFLLLITFTSYSIQIVKMKDMLSDSFNKIQIFERNKLEILIISILCLISAFIYSFPSLLSNYPVGFDTYRLHTIRINYILNNGKQILGDLITKDTLNPFCYQWGFHLIIGVLGVLIEKDTLILLRFLPIFTGFLFPIAIYTASPFFGIKQRKMRLLGMAISPFTLSNPNIHGLIYPMPSSLGLILFTISLRFIYEYDTADIKINKNFWKNFSILLFPIFFLIYKGLGAIYFIMLLSLATYFFMIRKYNLSITKFSIANKNIKLSLPLFLYLIILFSITLAMGIISAEFFSHSKYLFNIPQIFNIYLITGKAMFLFFTFSLFYILLNKENSRYSLSSLLLVLITIISSGAFVAIRWILYALPIVISFNSILFSRILELIPSLKLSISLKKKSIFVIANSLRNLGILFIICIISIEPLLYITRPATCFGPNFTNEETNLLIPLESLETNSIVLNEYRINRLLNAYAINKTLIYTPLKNYLHYYEVSRSELYSLLRGNLNIISKIPYTNNIEFLYIIIEKLQLPETEMTLEIIYQSDSFIIFKYYINQLKN